MYVPGAAAAHDLDGDAVALDEADRVDHAAHRLVALARLLLERPDRQQVALVAHDALERHALGLRDQASEVQSGLAGQRAGAFHPDVDADQQRDVHACLEAGCRGHLDVGRAVGAGDDLGPAVQRRDPVVLLAGGPARWR